MYRRRELSQTAVHISYKSSPRICASTSATCLHASSKHVNAPKVETMNTDRHAQTALLTHHRNMERSAAPHCHRRTYLIWHGSVLPLTVAPSAQRSGFTEAQCVLTCWYEACVLRISHQGASVSSNSRSNGTCAAAANPSSVFKLQPLIPVHSSNRGHCVCWAQQRFTYATRKL